ncbi:MaoC/PaaZ C-terminal domain-containing protein [Nocardioides nitrophenolicus]|uniref:MaoC/PaaZ C-terminal domain-containing protein n=1 Tax=Nocardioides nitrophenolicus TaxID=60489 RepID=UPI0019561FFD|nr:MaoC/PaaZ C-terminal domain-containing protein [Nocardioides nitrophenolicus]MBM7519622.1 acyl dehydratase [Nocardioides nitrophenolicus]
MPIDLATALAAPPAVRAISWTRRDVLLYHLSLGAGRHADADPELAYTFEQGVDGQGLQVLPTFAVVAGKAISAGDEPSAPAMRMPGIDVDLHRVLHGGQALTVHRPIPTAGSAELSTCVADVWDKGNAAVVVLEHRVADADGPLWTGRMQIWVRGEGGFGGGPGPDPAWSAPDRAPDHVLDSPTDPGQALLYRLNGDLNPLHADPAFAASAGFDRPILHGLASYGIVAKALVDRLLDGDATRLRGLAVRFAGTLVPGETIRTSVWCDGDRLVLAASCPERGDQPVLSHAVAEVTA